MTSFFSWNMRGFNMSRKHLAVHRWILKEKPIFGCLVETRVKQENHSKCMKVALPGWNSITNYDHHRLGKIWFCWSDKVQVSLLHMSSQVITCAIHVPETEEHLSAQPFMHLTLKVKGVSSGGSSEYTCSLSAPQPALDTTWRL